MSGECADRGLYGNLIGIAFENLPAEVKALHSEWKEAEGRARVMRGKSFLARLAAKAMSFPDAGEDVPLRVTFERHGTREIWTRRFGNREFSSEHSAGRGRNEGHVCERFGPSSFAIALAVSGDALILEIRRWSAFGLPMPMWLCPRSEAFETSQDGRFRFNVEISHPLTGPIVHYEEWLEPTMLSS